MRIACALILAVIVASCGRAVREPADGPPSGPLDPSRIEQPAPRPEPLSRYGNHSPYTVLGRTYHVLPSAEGFVERGMASWYGSKFHGRRTSSGEPYDMYRVSAAHRTLPLPTWVEVTNLENGRSLVVRVNDRGPFRRDRVIDLSYAAALKLGIVEAGTAEVEVRAITFGERPLLASAGPSRLPVQLQVGAFSDRERARSVQRRLEQARVGPVDVSRARTAAGRVWRVRVGPVDDAGLAMNLIDRIVSLGLERPVFIYP